MFGSLGMPELLIILVVVLLLFGSRRLPELAKGMGQSIKEFKRGIAEVQLEDKGQTTVTTPASETKKQEVIS